MGALGNITKFASPSGYPSDLSGFVSAYGATAARFYLLSAAKWILPNERIQVCWRNHIPEHKNVKVIYSGELKRARASGLMKCGSVWVCGPCQAFIQEKRRAELQTALERMKGELVPFMATYTIKHNVGNSLRELIEKMNDAYRRMKSGKAWQTTKEIHGIEGSIRALEITFGENGWHPHFHEVILLSQSGYDAGGGGAESWEISIENSVFPKWKNALGHVGLEAIRGVGLKVTSNHGNFDDYVSKYGRLPAEWSAKQAAYEVAGAAHKTARFDSSLTPQELLYFATSDNRAKALWLEYFHATKGRSQLQWSRGLKQRLGIEEISDELAAEGIATDTDVTLAMIEFEEWRYIHDKGYVAQLMTIANEGDAPKLLAFIDKILPARGLDNWSMGH